ncbi:hypothetical protein K438DRAFT_1780751 [Mycena galopus ATCC 62051]|nr:hypothetical protein K438DRAFT_1780751 [Mycena galopus ATCC 62051]
MAQSTAVCCTRCAGGRGGRCRGGGHVAGKQGNEHGQVRCWPCSRGVKVAPACACAQVCDWGYEIGEGHIEATNKAIGQSRWRVWAPQASGASSSRCGTDCSRVFKDALRKAELVAGGAHNRRRLKWEDGCQEQEWAGSKVDNAAIQIRRTGVRAWEVGWEVAWLGEARGQHGVAHVRHGAMSGVGDSVCLATELIGSTVAQAWERGRKREGSGVRWRSMRGRNGVEQPCEIGGAGVGARHSIVGVLRMQRSWVTLLSVRAQQTWWTKAAQSGLQRGSTMELHDKGRSKGRQCGSPRQQGDIGQRGWVTQRDTAEWLSGWHGRRGDTAKRVGATWSSKLSDSGKGLRRHGDRAYGYGQQGDMVKGEGHGLSPEG